MLTFLHQRCKDTANILQDVDEEIEKSLLFGHWVAFFKRVQKIRFDIPDGIGIVEAGSAFKMQVEASEVEIDRSHRCDAVVGKEGLGMDKALRVLVDLHARA